MTATPELDKIRAAREAGSEAIGAFIEWLQQHGWLIAHWETPTYRVEPTLRVFDKTHVTGEQMPAHWSTARSDPGLCGALPQPHSERGASVADQWYGMLYGMLAGPSLKMCSECQRRYTARDWPVRESKTQQLFGVHRPINDWLADYFGINSAAADQERTAILDNLRAQMEHSE